MFFPFLDSSFGLVGFRRFGLPWIITLLFVAILSGHRVMAQNAQAQDHASLGISLAKQGKLAEAEQELQEAVHVAPAVASYRAQLGSILGLQGKWKDALESFQKAVDLE